MCGELCAASPPIFTADLAVLAASPTFSTAFDTIRAASFTSLTSTGASTVIASCAPAHVFSHPDASSLPSVRTC